MNHDNTSLIIKEWGMDKSDIPNWLLSEAENITDCNLKEMKLGEILVARGVLTDKQVNEALISKNSNIQLGNHLLDIYSGKLAITNAILPAIATKLSAPYFKTLSETGIIISPILKAVPLMLDECEKHECIICEIANVHFIVFSSPDKMDAFSRRGLGDKENSLIEKHFTKRNIKLITAFSVHDFINTELAILNAKDDSSIKNISEIRSGDLMAVGGYRDKFARIMKECLDQNATDLHITPIFVGDVVGVEMRVKGSLLQLKSQFQLDKSEYYELRNYLTRITNATENGAPIYEPTDGEAITYIGDRRKVRLRTAFMPKGIFSDIETNPVRIVIRFMNYDTDIISLDRLGLDSIALKYIEESVELKGKMSLMVGPVGSGKSTTQYAILMDYSLKNKGQSIASIEDPIEQYIPDVDQIQLSNQSIKNGRGYAHYLKHLLRQDTNCIYIGEIRDHETALAASSFSSIGNKIFSTLHGQDENDALQRLMSMMPKDDEKFMLINNISHIFTQRLIPKLCDACKTEINEGSTLTALIKKADRWLTKSEEKPLFQHKSNPLKNDNTPTLFSINSTGCSSCNYSGITGMKPVIGVMDFTNEVKQILLSGKEDRFLKVRALRPLTMFDQIIPMVINGETDIESLNQ